MPSEMRISDFEMKSIQNAFSEVQLANALNGQLYLFGSRTSLAKRGGDIDLLWVLPKERVEKARKLKFDLIAKIKLAIDEQKIDVTIIADEDKSQDEFYISIQSQLIKIA